jgi:hypothetical protein
MKGAPVGSRTRRATTGSRRGSAPGPAGRGVKSDAAPARKALTSGPNKAEESAVEQCGSNPFTSQKTSSELEVDLEVPRLPGRDRGPGGLNTSATPPEPPFLPCSPSVAASSSYPRLSRRTASQTSTGSLTGVFGKRRAVVSSQKPATVVEATIKNFLRQCLDAAECVKTEDASPEISIEARVPLLEFLMEQNKSMLEVGTWRHCSDTWLRKFRNYIEDCAMVHPSVVTKHIGSRCLREFRNVGTKVERSS